MDPAYKVMLFGLGLAVFGTILKIFQLKVVIPRIRKLQQEAASAAQAEASRQP
jgi:hypothetical protein